jgi:nitric oxide reductase NorD protein
VVTDGEPADNDVRDPQYLRFDAKRAAEELARDGIVTYALSLDPHADQYVSSASSARRTSPCSTTSSDCPKNSPCSTWA